MIPVNWDKDTKSWIDTTEEKWEWNYNPVSYYKSNGTVEGNGEGKWANARTEDGSMWVWIPRYSYKIVGGYHETVESWNADDNLGEGIILIKFSNETEDIVTDGATTAEEGYIYHPAFTLGDKQLTGIWVAKYEMSMETNGVNTNPTTVETGNIYTSETVKMVSKPNVASWRWISVSKAFTNTYNYNRTLDSHLMRNSEWGAVAYLTNAIGRIPYINNSNAYITGCSGAEQDSAESTVRYDEDSNSNTEFIWNTIEGVKASTTHNVYDIYDFSGGSWERVAAYYTGGESGKLSGDVETDSYAGALYDAVNGSNKATLSKYVETYGTAYDSNKKGDAMYETSSNNGEQLAWDSDHSFAPRVGYPAISCGGYAGGSSSSGIFAFHHYTGRGGEDGGFRIILSIPRL